VFGIIPHKGATEEKSVILFMMWITKDNQFQIWTNM